MLTFAGDRAYWNLRQTGYAAAVCPGYPANAEGLQALQDHWFTSGEVMPRAPLIEDCDIQWAREAFSKLPKVLPLEKIPA